MDDSVKRVAATASVVGAAAFVGLFVWLYLTGALPFELALPLALINLVVLGFSVLLRGQLDD